MTIRHLITFFLFLSAFVQTHWNRVNEEHIANIVTNTSGSIAEPASSTAPDTQPTSSTAPLMPDYLFQQQAAIAFGIGLPQAPGDSPPIPAGAPA
ncbi:hypothetical protein SARC_16272, partial [Sphaeroforma arctica JP610]